MDLNVGGLWCPRCGDEYRPGFVACADCGVPLTDEPPAHLQPAEPAPRPAPYTGRIIELDRFPSRFEAEMTVTRLRAAGLRAMLPGDDADGWYPHLGFATGHRVLVAEDDLNAARQLLDAEETVRTGLPEQPRPHRRRTRRQDPGDDQG